MVKKQGGKNFPKSPQSRTDRLGWSSQPFHYDLISPTPKGSSRYVRITVWNSTFCLCETPFLNGPLLSTIATRFPVYLFPCSEIGDFVGSPVVGLATGVQISSGYNSIPYSIGWSGWLWIHGYARLEWVREQARPAHCENFFGARFSHIRCFLLIQSLVFSVEGSPIFRALCSL